MNWTFYSVLGWLSGWVMLMGGHAAKAQTPAWQTVGIVSAAGLSTQSTIKAVVPDASGGAYVVGSFTGTVSLGNVTLTSAGLEDVFVARWSGAGNQFVWAQRAGGPGNDIATAIAGDAAGLYIAGHFEGSAIFGGTTLTSAGNTDVFVAKLTDTGASVSFGWAQQAGGAGADQAQGLATNSSNVYVTGIFNSIASFGATTLSSAGIDDIFIGKLTDAGTNGVFGWAQQAGGAGNDFASAITVQNNMVYVTGLFSGAVSFGPTRLQSSGPFAVFITALLDAGQTNSFAWAQLANGAGFCVANAISVQGSAVYLAGRFQGSITLGTNTLTNTGLGGSYDVFVAKVLDAGIEGTFAWAQRAGGQLSDYATGVAVRGSAVYVVGGFGGAAAFGATSLTSVGNSDDVFVTKLLDAGGSASFVWANAAGGAGYEQAQAIALGTGNNVYVGGSITPPASFGTIATTSLTSSPSGFIALLADPTATLNAAPRHGSINLYPNPARGRVTVQLPPSSGVALTTLAVLDALGRTMRIQAANTGSATELDLAGLPAGVYAVRIVAGTQTATRRLIVE